MLDDLRVLLEGLYQTFTKEKRAKDLFGLLLVAEGERKGACITIPAKKVELAISLEKTLSRTSLHFKKESYEELQGKGWNIFVSKRQEHLKGFLESGKTHRDKGRFFGYPEEEISGESPSLDELINFAREETGERDKIEYLLFIFYVPKKNKESLKRAFTRGRKNLNALQDLNLSEKDQERIQNLIKQIKNQGFPELARS